MKISVAATIAAPIAEVWRAYTRPEDIKQWNAATDDWHTTAATVDLRVGGKFSSRMEAKDGSSGFDFAGTYTKVVQHSLIEYSFGERHAQVKFDEGADGVHVCVTFDSENTHSIAQQREGWQAILNNFSRHVEGQQAQRSRKLLKPFTISLWFDHQAEEAAQFYTSVFRDGKITMITRYGKEGHEHHGKAEGSVMSVAFEVNGQKFVAINGGPHFTFNESMSLMVHCDTQAEIDAYWEKLTAAGGKPVQCGWLKDKFGFSWQIVPSLMDDMLSCKDPEKLKRVMAAMYPMVKFDIAALKRAYDGR